jgi:trk system potassium uptake protein TrkA
MSSVIVIGGGKVGSHLASLLIEGSHHVVLVEGDEGKAGELSRRFEDGVVIVGSGTEAAVLERAGIRGCDVVAAVTGADETNLVVCSLARFEFTVPRVIARIVDPANAWMYEEDMGVDVALNQADLLAHLVAEEMSLGEMTTLLKLRKGQYAVVEEKIAPSSAVVGRRYGQVEWPSGCRIVAVIRKGDLIPITSEVVLAPADEVLALTHSGAVEQLAAILGAAADRGPASA